VKIIGARCEQLMKAAEKEIEMMEKKYKASTDIINEMKILTLPSYKQMQSLKKEHIIHEHAVEEEALRMKVSEAEKEIHTLKKRLKRLQESTDRDGFKSKQPAQAASFPDDLLPALANLVALSGSISSMAIAANFCSQSNAIISKKLICTKIDEIATKEKRLEEGDRKAVWHIYPEYEKLLYKETILTLSKTKDEHQDVKLDRHRHKSTVEEDHDHQQVNSTENDGALGPDGEYVPFPHYDGIEEPKEARRAFTIFCSASRREVKESLDVQSRSNKVYLSHLYRHS